MSWIKIEFGKEQIKANRKCKAEQIDYEKICEITHEVVKEELTAQQNNQFAPLTKEDILETVSEAILLAEKKREIQKKENIKKTKLSCPTIIAMILFGAVALFFALGTISVWVTAGGDQEQIIAGAKLAVIAATYAMVVFLLYAVGKNRDETFTYNAISILFGLVAIVTTLIQQGG